jgi:hypothetical protein
MSDDKYNYGLYSLKSGPALPGCFIINDTHRCMPIYTNVRDLNLHGMIFRNQNRWVLGALKGMYKVMGNDDINYKNAIYEVNVETTNPNDYTEFPTIYRADSVKIFRDANNTIVGSTVT